MPEGTVLNAHEPQADGGIERERGEAREGIAVIDRNPPLAKLLPLREA